MLLSQTVRECCRRTLATTSEPMTVADIADLVNTSPAQAGRALRQLEAEGAATRTRRTAPGGAWRSDQWTATQTPDSATK